MPTTIVTDSYPAPEFNLTQRDVEQCLPELEAYWALFEPAFDRVEQFRRSQVYLKGLLSTLGRKTTERIALELRENVRDLQHFVGQSPWETAPLVAIHQRQIGETLGEADGVALIDESGVVKQGVDSVGVGPQYCGCGRQGRQLAKRRLLGVCQSQRLWSDCGSTVCAGGLV